MMKSTDTVPVLLIAGFLGSGKTTLLNRLLSNRRGIRFAVIVNDIGEVNIDAEMIAKGGIVGQEDGTDLVALQNGCICCTLRSDLIAQIDQLLTGDFDYIVIEASGVCEPAPIAQTICAMEQMPSIGEAQKRPRLDAIVTVVDALRLAAEFGCGHALTEETDEEDIERLIIEQIEFCNIILLNKIDEVTPQQGAQIRAIIRELQPDARIIDTNYADVDLDLLINSSMFDFDKVATSARWVKEIEGEHHEDEHEQQHHDHDHHDHYNCDDPGCSCHHHHHHHGEGEAEEYGIGTFVYFRRRPFDFNKFDRFVNNAWPKNVIRTKGVLYFSQNRDMSILFEQAGPAKSIREAGHWFATAPAEELEQFMANDANLRRDWDEEYGDRMIKLVFIGQDLDKKALSDTLDECLASH